MSEYKCLEGLWLPRDQPPAATLLPAKEGRTQRAAGGRGGALWETRAGSWTHHTGAILPLCFWSPEIIRFLMFISI